MQSRTVAAVSPRLVEVPVRYSSFNRMLFPVDREGWERGCSVRGLLPFADDEPAEHMGLCDGVYLHVHYGVLRSMDK